MAYNIINGFTGLPHVGAGHLATLAKALLGDAHVLDWGDRFACTISTDGRTATIGTGALNMGEGWLPFSDEPVKLAIDAGTAGQKRNDLIVARVRKDGGDLNLGGIQSFELAVVKGANTTGTPTDPKDTATNTDSYPLWRIPLDGVTVGTPVALYKTLATLATVGDSLTQINTAQLKMPYSDRTIALTRVGRMVVASAYITLNSSFSNVSNQSVTETIPAGFRPMPNIGGLLHGSDNTGAISFYLWGNEDGSMRLNGTGNAGRFVGISGCWIAA